MQGALPPTPTTLFENKGVQKALTDAAHPGDSLIPPKIASSAFGLPSTFSREGRRGATPSHAEYYPLPRERIASEERRGEGVFAGRDADFLPDMGFSGWLETRSFRAGNPCRGAFLAHSFWRSKRMKELVYLQVK